MVIIFWNFVIFGTGLIRATSKSELTSIKTVLQEFLYELPDDLKLLEILINLEKLGKSQKWLKTKPISLAEIKVWE